MKKVLYIIIVLLYCSVFAVDVANAQDLPPEIDLDNPEDQRIYNQRIDELIRDLYVHLSIMTGSKDSRGKTISHTDRLEAKKRALKLFVNNGEPIQLSPRLTRSALVGVTSLNPKKQIPARPVIKYFDSQIWLRESKYSEIKIEIIGNIEISPIKKVGNGEYRCTATYTQGYQGWNKERKAKSYGDKTVKSIDIWISSHGGEVQIKFFDIIAKETYPY